MSTFSRLVHCDGRTDRLTFQRNVALLALGKSAVDMIVMRVDPLADQTHVALSWLNPFVLVHPWIEGRIPFAICLGTFLFFAALVWNSVHRARDMGWSHWLGLFTAVPFAGPVLTLVLVWHKSARRTVWDLVEP